MIRNLKALGLALMAAFAFSAVAVSSASASSAIFWFAGTPTVLTGTSENSQLYSRGGVQLSCEHLQLEGTQAGIEVSTIELQANYTTAGCKGPSNSETHWDFTTGKCGYHFTGTASKTAQVKLICTAAGTPSMTLTPTVFGASLCTIHYPPQTFGGHVVFTNKGGDTVTTESTLTNISSTRTGSALCGPVNDSAGTFAGNVTITGERHSGQSTNIEVT